MNSSGAKTPVVESYTTLQNVQFKNRFEKQNRSEGPRPRTSPSQQDCLKNVYAGWSLTLRRTVPYGRDTLFKPVS